MNYSVEVQPNKKVEQGLKKLPDETIYKMARKTLDLSQTHIPMSALPRHSGTLRKSTMARGVRGSKGDYYLTSPTNYATRVWNLSDNGTNWTISGTHSKWFAWTLKTYNKQIEDSSINEAWKDTM